MSARLQAVGLEECICFSLIACLTLIQSKEHFYSPAHRQLIAITQMIDGAATPAAGVLDAVK